MRAQAKVAIWLGLADIARTSLGVLVVCGLIEAAPPDVLPPLLLQQRALGDPEFFQRLDPV